MKVRERTPDRLVLRAHSPLGGALVVLMGLGLGFFGVVDIVDNDGTAGWYGVPLGLLIAALGLAIMLLPVDYVLNRADGTFLHIRRGRRHKVLARKDLPQNPRAAVTERITVNSKGHPRKSYHVSLQGTGQPVALAGPMGKAKARALSDLVQGWLEGSA